MFEEENEYLFSHEGSKQFKETIAQAKILVPNHNSIQELTDISTMLEIKKLNIHKLLENPSTTEHIKKVAQTYYNDLDTVINMIDRRKTELASHVAGKTRRARKHIKRKRPNQSRSKKRRT